jgi:hypothetical protein
LSLCLDYIYYNTTAVAVPGDGADAAQPAHGGAVYVMYYNIIRQYNTIQYNTPAVAVPGDGADAAQPAHGGALRGRYGAPVLHEAARVRGDIYIYIYV